MKAIRSILINSIATTFAALMLTACGGSDGGGDGGGSSSGGLSLNITDAPVLNEDIAEVIVCFTDVIIHPSDGSPDIERDVTNGIDPCRAINLKELTNGNSVLLGEFDLPAGDYSWIRLDIDPNETVIVERTVNGVPDEDEPPEPPTEADTIHDSAKLDCSSCDQSHLKLNRNFTIENTGFINFTIDFDLHKSLTLQLPQSEKPRPNYAYKLRPTLRIIDTELASTFIWGSVTDTLPTGGDKGVCRVYTYTGDILTVVPDDMCNDGCTAGLNAGDRPLNIAEVNDASFEYRTGSLLPG